jgi:hypothetical protein
MKANFFFSKSFEKKERVTNKNFGHILLVIVSYEGLQVEDIEPKLVTPLLEVDQIINQILERPNNQQHTK